MPKIRKCQNIIRKCEDECKGEYHEDDPILCKDCIRCVNVVSRKEDMFCSDNCRIDFYKDQILLHEWYVKHYKCLIEQCTGYDYNSDDNYFECDN